MAEFATSVLKEQIRAFHEDCRRLLKTELDEDGVFCHHLVSRTALDKLIQAPIGKLAMNQKNIGIYVLVRVLEKGYLHEECSWFNVVDDPDGDVIGLALYNYPLDELFAPGTILIIKEPYCKYKMGFPFIRCDCPTDIFDLLPSHPKHHLAESTAWKNPIVFEDPLAFDPVPRSSEDWRLRRNELFKENKLVLAQEAYFLGEKMCLENDTNADPILLRMLEVYLNLGYYEWVIEEAKWLSYEHEALFRKGKAHYMLRQFEEALSAFRDTIEIFRATGKLELELYKEQVEETRDMLKRAETRVKESRGEFSIDDIINESKKILFQEVDCADFCVPVEIWDRSTADCQRLTLKTGVKKGDVVMISKALATAFRDERNSLKYENMKLNLELDDDKLFAKVRAKIYAKEQGKIVSNLMKLVLKNPKTFKSMLFKLYPFQWFCDSDEESEPICDVYRIIVSNEYTMRDDESMAITGSGLFYLPSFLTLSLKPNVVSKFYNDVMVVTALEDIAAGTELSIPNPILQYNLLGENGSSQKTKLRLYQKP